MNKRVFASAASFWAASVLWIAPQAAGLPAGARPTPSAQAVKPARVQTPAPSAPAIDYRATIDRYCVTCHNDRLKTAGLALDKMDVANVPAGADVWEKVVRKVRVGMMPPQNAPRPDVQTQQALVAHLTTELDRAALAKPNPGRGLIHRLNRVEYANAIRDLFDVDVDTSTMLPPDDSAYGFDNIADALGVSPVLLERYLTAADKITSLAIGDPET